MSNVSLRERRCVTDLTLRVVFDLRNYMAMLDNARPTSATYDAATLPAEHISFIETGIKYSRRRQF